MAKFLLYHYLLRSIFLICVSQFSLLEPSKFYYDNATIDDFGGTGSKKSENKVPEIIVKDSVIDNIADTIFTASQNQTSNESHHLHDSSDHEWRHQEEMTSYRSGRIALSSSALAFMVISCLLAGFIVAAVACFIFWYFYLKPQYESRRGSPAVSKKPPTYDQDQKERNSFKINPTYPKGQVGQMHAQLPGDRLFKEPKDIDSNEHWMKQQVDDIIKVVVNNNSGEYGLGFSIYTDANNEIFIKNTTTSLAGNMNTGDRIMSIKINCETILYEDVLTILNYGSPYPMTLEILKNNRSKVSQGQPGFRDDYQVEEHFIEQYLEMVPRKSKSLENLQNSIPAIFTLHRKSLSENNLQMLMTSRDVTPIGSLSDQSSLREDESSYPPTKSGHVIEKYALKLNRKSKSQEDFHQFFNHHHNHIQYRNPYPYPYPDSDSNFVGRMNRDSGLGDSHNRNDFLLINRLQYEKLAYFRDQLLLQQNDLKSMNLVVSDPPRLPKMNIDDFDDD